MYAVKTMGPQFNSQEMLSWVTLDMFVNLSLPVSVF